MRIADAARTAMVAGFATQAAVGSGTAVVQIYTGSAPAAIGDAPAGDLLLEFDLATPPLVAGAAGVTAVDGVPISSEGLDDGTAAYARFVNENGDALADTESVGTSGTEVVLSSTAVTTGADFDLIQWTFTQPAGSV